MFGVCFFAAPGHVGATMTLDLGHVVQSAHGEAIKLTTQGLGSRDEKGRSTQYASAVDGNQKS